MAEGKESFMLYCDIIHTVRKLSDADAGQLFKHILSYVADEHPVTDNLIVEIAFEPIRQQLIAYKKSQKRENYHWNWKGGITPKNHAIRNSLSIKMWRQSVFQRDKYKCQICLSKGGILHAHHIKEFSLFPDLRVNIENGVTLCQVCHKLVHSKKRNNNGKR